MQRFRLDGVNAHDNVFDSALVNLVCERNGRGGMSVGGASRLAILDCRAHRNAVAQLRLEGWSTTRVQRSKLVAQAGPAWVRVLGPQGRGARLSIDGKSQQAREGFSDPQDWDELLALEKAAQAPPPDNDVAPSNPSQPSASAEAPLDAQDPPLDTGDPFEVDDLVDTPPEGIAPGGVLGGEEPSAVSPDPAATSDEEDPFADDIFDEPLDGEPSDDPFEI